MALSDDVADAAVYNGVELLRVEAGLRRDLKRAMIELRRELAGVLADEGENIRAQMLLREVDGILTRWYEGTKNKHRETLQRIAAVEALQAADEINAAIAVSLITPATTPQLLEALDTTVLIEGAPVSEWWDRQSEAMRRRFADRVRFGVLAGETTPQIIAKVRADMDVSYRHAEALVRTSVNAAANAGRLATYQANDEVIRGYQAVVTLDARTSATCRARSGGKWDTEGNPIDGSTVPWWGAPPWHWNCRSTLIAIVKSWEELTGIPGIPEIPPGTRASVDGQVARDVTYDEWLRGRGVTEQKKILGESRWKLWQSGDASLADMIDQTGRPLTLEQLEAKAGK